MICAGLDESSPVPCTHVTVAQACPRESWRAPELSVCRLGRPSLGDRERIAALVVAKHAGAGPRAPATTPAWSPVGVVRGRLPGLLIGLRLLWGLLLLRVLNPLMLKLLRLRVHGRNPLIALLLGQGLATARSLKGRKLARVVRRFRRSLRYAMQQGTLWIWLP